MSASPASSPVAARRSLQNSALSRAPPGSRRGAPLWRRLGRGRAEHGGVLSEVHRHAVEPGSDPHDVSRRAERVEVGRAVGRARGAAAPRSPTAKRGSGSACNGTSASRSVCLRPIPCQAGRKRPSAACSAGSTSRRRTASVARRIRRRTSGSHHSRSVPPGLSSPRTSSPRARALAAPTRPPPARARTDSRARPW